MTLSNEDFAGSIPAVYDRFLGPLLFRPYATDLAARVAALAPLRVLETAAGTGIVTEQLAHALPPEARIVATDLKPPMLSLAMATRAAPNVTWQACDALQLPFADGAFDAVVCQFGVMFFPDKLAAYREARRVLRPGGTFHFNVWDSLRENVLPSVVADAVRAAFPLDPPDFFARTPHGYYDIEAIRSTLTAAGFSRITAEKLQLRSRSVSSHDAVLGFTQGTPLRTEIENRDANGLDAVSEAAALAVAARFGATIDVPMQAIVFAATR